MKATRYQNRFVTVSEAGAIERGEGKPGTIVVVERAEFKRWVQYFIDQRTRARIDPDLTDNQRKEIREACAAFEWTPYRTVLIKEPVG